MIVVYYIASVVFQILAIIFYKERAYGAAIIAALCSLHPIAKGVCQ